MLTEEQRRAIGHSLDNMVKDCVFKQRDCNNETNFVVTTSATYGTTKIIPSRIECTKSSLIQAIATPSTRD